MVKIIRSIIKSVSRGVLNNPEIRKIINRYPRFFRFVKKRLTPNEKFGLYLTIGSIITFFFILLFFKILRDYIGQESITRSDFRLLSAFELFRTPVFNQVMLFITYLGKGEIIIFGVIIASIILFLLRRRFYLLSLIISVIGGEIFVTLIKNIIERPRPPLADALVAESSFSFPSGHAFTAISFYGLLTFLISHNTKKKFIKILVVILGSILILLIGLSRIFLGVHWPSDVLASFASGLAWLTILITAANIKTKFSPVKNFPSIPRKYLIIISTTLILIWLGFIIFFYKTHPLVKLI